MPNIEKFICPMCSTGFDDRVRYFICESEKMEIRQRVCGRCYLLVSIVDQLKELNKEMKEWRTSTILESNLS